MKLSPYNHREIFHHGGLLITLGTATAIQEIWSEVARGRTGKLTIVSPFLGMAVEEQLWPILGGCSPSGLDLALVTATTQIPAGLEALMTYLTWRGRLQIIQVNILHAKVVAYTSPDGSVAYIGSANFTSAGLARNLESGVVLRSPPDDPHHTISSIHDYFRSLKDQSHQATPFRRSIA